DLMLREIADSQALMRDALPGCERMRARYRLQQRRLARAVGSEQPDACARQDAPIDIGEHGCIVGVAECRMIEPRQLVCGNASRRERKFEWTVDVRSGNQLHSFDGPDAALRLLRLRRFGAKTIDEFLQMRDLSLLLR